MKTLLLVRHAKSSWDDPTLSDEDRPLNARGKRDAPKMGRRLARRDVSLDLILSSPANRAITTAQVLADRLDYKLKNIVSAERLYPGTPNDMLKVVHNLGNKLNRVMLVGHDPALSKLAQRFSSDIVHMPTCAVAAFTFETKLWRDVSRATLVTAALDWPKKP